MKNYLVLKNNDLSKQNLLLSAILPANEWSKSKSIWEKAILQCSLSDNQVETWILIHTCFLELDSIGQNTGGENGVCVGPISYFILSF